MRYATFAVLAFAYGMAAATPVEVPVISLEQREAGSSDASACFVTAFTKINCAGDVGDNLGVPEQDSQGACVGVGETSGEIRHSYEISAACPTLSVFLYPENECAGNEPEEAAQGPGCFNIVSDTGINSIRFVQPE